MTVPPALPPLSSWDPLVRRALEEDLGGGDVTTRAVLPRDRRLEAAVVARSALVACGLPVAQRVFERLGDCELEPAVAEGQRVSAGTELARVRGSAHAVLAGERTALNFLGRLCGVATWTRAFVEAVAGTGARVVDTRKTLPGWRVLDKYAVATGGGVNHRAGLFDAMLVKDNHVVAAGGVGAAVKAARAGAPPHLWLQVEVESEAAAEEALEAGADALLLDNRSLDELRALVARFRERTILEASGGVSLESVRAVAETGVHRVSIGALTHSAPVADVALDALEACGEAGTGGAPGPGARA